MRKGGMRLNSWIGSGLGVKCYNFVTILVNNSVYITHLLRSAMAFFFVTILVYNSEYATHLLMDVRAMLFRVVR